MTARRAPAAPPPALAGYPPPAVFAAAEALARLLAARQARATDLNRPSRAREDEA